MLIMVSMVGCLSLGQQVTGGVILSDDVHCGRHLRQMPVF